MAKRLIKEMVVYHNNPWTDDTTTHITVENEGGGEFFEITQPDMVAWLGDGKIPTLRIGFDEIDELYDALKTIRACWEIAEQAPRWKLDNT